MSHVHIDIDDESHAKIKYEAKLRHKTQKGLIQELIVLGLKNLE